MSQASLPPYDPQAPCPLSTRAAPATATGAGRRGFPGPQLARPGGARRGRQRRGTETPSPQVVKGAGTPGSGSTARPPGPGGSAADGQGGLSHRLIRRRQAGLGRSLSQSPLTVGSQKAECVRSAAPAAAAAAAMGAPPLPGATPVPGVAAPKPAAAHSSAGIKTPGLPAPPPGPAELPPLPAAAAARTAAGAASSAAGLSAIPRPASEERRFRDSAPASAPARAAPASRLHHRRPARAAPPPLPTSPPPQLPTGARAPLPQRRLVVG